jgi:hypothetical protein
MSVEPHGVTTIKHALRTKLPTNIGMYLIWGESFLKIKRAHYDTDARHVICQVKTGHSHHSVRSLVIEDNLLVILTAENLMDSSVSDILPQAKGVGHPDFGHVGSQAPGFTERPLQYAWSGIESSLWLG